MQTKIHAVLFDLDGTILDTNELIIQSFLSALAGAVPPGFGREMIIPSMGLPLEKQLRLFTGRQNVEDLITAYFDFNSQHHNRLIRLFPFVKEVLDALNRSGVQLGVVTTKWKSSTTRSLTYLGIMDLMSAIVTLDDVQNPKPHPEPIRMALKQLGVMPESAIMVGDSEADIVSAREAGVVPIGVSWSLKGEEQMKRFGAIHVIHNMRELLNIVGVNGD
ncbi:HAD-IA family hydrolase [Cohnella sp. REN36]|uniref:HAD-IA family hydrolase n=1 Tax=Cohnella sp. REN36 TaxID=2887347 RepID=UPI001D13D89F|nr:HAD-IA family hydrolase [Cohnella sp. REN36]MCC3372314.1 HAD-IA family hydrolase [Cohnella sp. REN36]